MTIKAVVFDIGSVLEVIDDSVFPAPFEAAARARPRRRLGVPGWPATRASAR